MFHTTTRAVIRYREGMSIRYRVLKLFRNRDVYKVQSIFSVKSFICINLICYTVCIILQCENLDEMLKN